MKKFYFTSQIIKAKSSRTKIHSRWDQQLGLSDVIHIGVESLQDGLGYVQTYRTTLASAYILYHLFAM